METREIPITIEYKHRRVFEKWYWLEIFKKNVYKKIDRNEQETKEQDDK